MSIDSMLYERTALSKKPNTLIVEELATLQGAERMLLAWSCATSRRRCAEPALHHENHYGVRCMDGQTSL